MLDQYWAQKVTKKASSIIKASVQIANKSGQIIATSNSERLGEVHQAALYSIQRNLPIEIEDEDVAFWRVPFPGIIVPFEYKDDTYGAVLVSGQPEEIRPYSRLLKLTAEFIVEQEIERSMRFEEALSRKQLLSNILFNQQKILQSYNRKYIIDALGLNEPLAVASIFINSTSKIKTRALKACLDSWQLQNDDIIELTPQEIIFIFKSNTNRGTNEKKLKQFITQTFEPDLAERTLITLGDFNTGIHGLVQSYNESQALKKLLTSQDQLEGVYTYKEHELEIMCQNIKRFTPNNESALVANYKKLLDFGEDKYLNDTVEAYFRNHGKLIKTANDLYIHRNTLNYRIKKIYEITGWDPNTIDGIVLLRIAQYLYKNH
ncbi:sugar diacid recognition domain-containing protein [Staphylococcus sp. 17KM0847]|uniref:sugar diacid recognition domain-containing protein n=1 Tax=Staphylococcus sp. 17KM0847 TaxID=2583989 RepID=UPI0015DCED13|nr:sugar diacid recognition domain-containing protein [Staphylococcus sp. 17KM0847]QLK86791.1 sugar diacid utilization regulator [Staphylococcus sp. 17KM0847]